MRKESNKALTHVPHKLRRRLECLLRDRIRFVLVFCPKSRRFVILAPWLLTQIHLTCATLGHLPHKMLLVSERRQRDLEYNRSHKRWGGGVTSH